MEQSRDMLRAAFKAAYTALNAAQKQAVDTIDGPVMVIAGPGTGKTQILTLRIVNILTTTDTAPESVLALTFTDAGAVNMRERLRTFLGSEAYRVPIFTFHSFCEHLIRTYPEAYDRIIGGRLANDVERYALIESILEADTFAELRPSGDPTYHLGNIISKISELKREAIGPDAFSVVIAAQETVLAGIEQLHQKGAHKGKVRGEYKEQEKVVNRNRELLIVYRQYEALLKDARLYDYDDMILETITALETHEAMLLSVQELYQYVHADEHQDVNGSQNRILELITSYHNQPNIFVVGDEKQAIYRFQGASLENFLYFENVYGKTTTIALTENYRSGQNILDISHSLIEVTEGPLQDLRVPLNANTTTAGTVSIAAYSQQAVEDDALVQEIQAVLASGVPKDEIAVIVRTNREVEAIARSLQQAGIAVSASADTDVLTHPVTDTICALIELVVHPEHERALAAILHSSFIGITRADLVRVLAAQSYKTPLSILVQDGVALTEAGVVNVEPFTNLFKTISEAAERDGIEPPQRVLAHLVSASGLKDHIITHDQQGGAQLIRRLYDEVEAMVRRDNTTTLSDVVTTLARHRKYGIALTAPALASSERAVHIMTAHKAKGREFQVVFAPHLLDNAWGGRKHSSFFTIPLTRHKDPTDAFDDERRLFYVVLTRAKEAVYLSYAKQNTDGKDRNPTRFLDELVSPTLLYSDVDKAETAFNPLTIITPLVNSKLDFGLFRDLLQQRGLSATSLNNYHKSPWTFVYRNLLRLPDVQSESLLFGNAVHGVLETITKQYTLEGKLPNASEIKLLIERALGRLPLSVTEYTRLHKRALEALVPYAAALANTISPGTREEFKVSVRMQTGLVDFPEILLTGKLDRLDVDKDGNVLRVVDYKTGKPKTRGQIEGTTKNSEGDYKRQLAFYALLLELYGDERLRTRTGSISFVEPDKNGELQEETFVITDEEIAAVRTDIIKVVEEISTGSFMNAVCDDSVCEYCHLVELLRE